ncbi:MAG: hypothetical protein ABH875_05335 [Candidatus Omnitrophota bacterium]
MSTRRRSIYLSAGPEAGGLLILAIWSVCMLTTFAVILSYGVRQKVSLVKRLDDRDKLRYVADACVKQAIIDIKRLVETGEEDENRNWIAAMSAEKKSEVGEGTIVYAIIDEERKININTANQAILENIFKLTGGLGEMDAQNIAASIIDWRDEDSMLSIADGSAEDRYYGFEHYPYGAMDREIEVLDEVVLIKDFTPELLRDTRDYITIYGDGKVNINTAPEEVFIALGLSEDLAGIISLYRNGEDGIAGTIDDYIFDKHAKIVPDLSKFYPMSESRLANLTQVVNKHLAVDSNFFTVKGKATLGKRKVFDELSCVIDRSGRVIYWHESL